MRVGVKDTARMAGAPLLLVATVCCSPLDVGRAGSAQQPSTPASPSTAKDESRVPEPPNRRNEHEGAVPWLRDGVQPTADGALPEIGIEHYGMHIGGESNSPEAKAPLLGALEARFDELLQCYRHVETPLETGSFGTDLLIGRTGGAPEVQSTRQKLGGEALEHCVTHALLKVSFPSRPRPVVVSYSFVYTVNNPAGDAAKP